MILVCLVIITQDKLFNQNIHHLVRAHTTHTHNTRTQHTHTTHTTHKNSLSTLVGACRCWGR
jgi:hypothetical protein